jgi:hypothetical protein
MCAAIPCCVHGKQQIGFALAVTSPSDPRDSRRYERFLILVRHFPSTGSRSRRRENERLGEKSTLLVRMAGTGWWLLVVPGGQGRDETGTRKTVAPHPPPFAAPLTSHLSPLTDHQWSLPFQHGPGPSPASARRPHLCLSPNEHPQMPPPQRLYWLSRTASRATRAQVRRREIGPAEPAR